MPANLAASLSAHSFPAFCSKIACGMRRHSEIECLGKASVLVFAVVPAPRCFLRGALLLFLTTLAFGYGSETPLSGMGAPYLYRNPRDCNGAINLGQGEPRGSHFRTRSPRRRRLMGDLRAGG